jgi:ClpP class serine protease
MLYSLLILFLLISTLQPLLQQKMLQSARKKLMTQIEKKHKSRIILLIHRQETMSILGFPVMRYIDINDSERVIRAIQMTDPDVPIDIIIHTPGGIALAAVQIARAIKDHPGKVTVYIPHYAMSGGTLIALSADEIVMGNQSVLGPVDPQIGQYPAPSIVNVLKQKPLSTIDDQTLILADIAEKAICQLGDSIIDILPDRYTPEEKRKIADTLTQGHWTHDFPITPDIAKKLGLNVNTNVPRDIYKLMDLFPQPVRHTPTVEYLPGYRKHENLNDSTP